MLRNPSRNPRSYDVISRRTVLDPDFSERPTAEQEETAREGFRALDTEERVLHDRVVDALVAVGATDVTVEVRRDLVTLDGRVADAVLLRTMEDAVANVPGVTTIHDRVVVGGA